MRLKLTLFGKAKINKLLKDRGTDVVQFYLYEIQDKQPRYMIYLEKEWKEAFPTIKTSRLLWSNRLLLTIISTPIGVSDEIFLNSQKGLQVSLVTKVISQKKEG